MTGFRITVDGAKETLKRLDAIPAKSRSALVMAVNDTAETIRAHVLRDITGEVNIKRQLLRERVLLTRATRGRISARVWALKKGLVLSHFPHKQLWTKGKGGKRRRAGVQVNVSGRTSVLPGAFIVALAGSGKTDGLIFIRTGKRSKEERGGGLSRSKIEALYGPSPSQILNTHLPDYTAEGERLLNANVRRQLERAKL